MITTHFSFFDELLFFLPKTYQEGLQIEYRCEETDSVKDCIEAQGVPHTEVEWILVNGVPVDFSYQMQVADKVEVYPHSSRLGLPVIVRPSIERIAFMTDANVGKLTKNLRLLGFPVKTDDGVPDKEIAAIAARENLIVLSRDVGLLKRKNVIYGRYLQSEKIEEQIIEVMKRFELIDNINPFTLCLVCNGEIQNADKESIKSLIAETIYHDYQQFYQCNQCQKVYWEGSHYHKMKENIEKVRKWKEEKL